MSEDSAYADPAKYLRMSEPFESLGEYQQACRDFFDGWSKLREQFGLTDVYVIIRAPVLADGDEFYADMMSAQSCGSSLHHEPMTAWAFGAEQNRREEMINRIMAGDRKRKKP